MTYIKKTPCTFLDSFSFPEKVQNKFQDCRNTCFLKTRHFLISGHWRRTMLLFSRFPSTTTEVATSSPATAGTKRWTPTRFEITFLREETEQRNITFKFFCRVEQRHQQLTAIYVNKTFFSEVKKNFCFQFSQVPLCYSHLQFSWPNKHTVKWRVFQSAAPPTIPNSFAQ